MKSEEVMRDHGKTFFWATAYLPSEEAEDIYTLYAFCRFVDDLVDVKGLSCQKIIEDLESQESKIPTVERFLAMTSRRKMSLEPAKILVNTIENDRCGQRIESWRTLLRYCYAAASTVGLMICDILGVKNQQAYAFAIDLGIAMQLTNIARDVYEDAIQNRIYLPQEAFSSSINADNILSAENLQQVLDVQEKILKMADMYYSSADNGMRFLPVGSRLAIIIASRLYQAKGKTIRKDPLKYFKKRANVEFLGKIYHTLRAVQFFCSDFIFPPSEKSKHDASLHFDLHYLPAIDSPSR